MSIRGVDGEAVPIIGDEPGKLVPTPTPGEYAVNKDASKTSIIYDTHHLSLIHI